MSVQRGLQQPESTPSATEAEPKPTWRFRWPNPADFNFNYHRLLAEAPNGIGKAHRPATRIAVIGAGAAGLTVASELRRCGYQNIDIYEASNRVGGRLESIPVRGGKTCYELGAMRMPFFPTEKVEDPEAEPDTKNSVLDHYRKAFDLRTIPFPNPGGDIAWTGVSLDDAYGRDEDREPVARRWAPGQPAPDPHLRDLAERWARFSTRFDTAARQRFGDDAAWARFWGDVVRRYDGMTFRQLALTPEISDKSIPQDGWFGGLGMTERQAGLFYLIGGGDGGWGAFYEISALFPIRTLCCGYGYAHRLFVGANQPPAVRSPHDSERRPLPQPSFLGIQALTDMLLYAPRATVQGGRPTSLYDDIVRQGSGIRLFTQSPVTRICKLCGDERGIQVHRGALMQVYDKVVLTQPTWALQLLTRFDGFDATDLPFPARRAIKGAHWISSYKVFYRLDKRYWEDLRSDGSPWIPQLIASDSFIQGAYGYAVDDEPGVVLVSYTWEDDAIKGNADTDGELAARCLRELDRICTERFGRSILGAIDQRTPPVVIRWSRRPFSRGCSKLYRSSTQIDNLCMLSHNQERGQSSGLYFAGEGYSVEGGWTEPALRSALDVVLWILDHTGEITNPELDFDTDYPKWPPHAHDGV